MFFLADMTIHSLYSMNLNAIFPLQSGSATSQMSKFSPAAGFLGGSPGFGRPAAGEIFDI